MERKYIYFPRTHVCRKLFIFTKVDTRDTSRNFDVDILGKFVQISLASVNDMEYIQCDDKTNSYLYATDT